MKSTGANLLQLGQGGVVTRYRPVWTIARLAGTAASGDLGFTIGESVIRVEGSPASYGKYLTIWRRLPDGSVRFLTDGGNPRPATP